MLIVTLTAFNNSGTVDVRSGTTFNGAYVQTAGATILNGGVIGSSSPLDIRGGSLAGSGNVIGSVSNGGNVTPGASPGSIASSQDYVQTTNGVFTVEIGGLIPGTQHDQLDVTGTVTLAGSLNVSLINGFTPNENDAFVLIDNEGTDAVIGTFANLAEGATITTGSGHQFEISYVGGDGNDVVLTAANRPPIAGAGGPYVVVRGGRVELDASATSDPDQSNDSLTYDWDLDADGQFDDATGIAPAFSAAGLDTPETRTVTLRVTDAGGLTDTDTATVQIIIAGLVTDPCDDGETALAVGGTSADDHILFIPGSTTGGIEVKLNSVSLGTFTPTGRLLAYGQGGDDDIQVSGSINVAAWLFGDDGNDKLKGGGGDDVLIGGDGDDLLVGKSGRDFLIGGNGSDRIVGNADDDIMVAGNLNFADVSIALCAIMAEWTSGNDYQTRVANLSNQGSGGANGNYFLISGSTVVDDDDDSEDVLTGSSGDDWFFFSSSEDRATDLNDEVFANDLDWILTEV